MRRTTLAGLTLALTAGLSGLIACTPQSTSSPGVPSASGASNQGSAPASSAPASSAPASSAPASSAPASSAPASSSSQGVPGAGTATVTFTVGGADGGLSDAKFVCVQTGGTVNLASDGAGDKALAATFTDTTVTSFVVTTDKYLMAATAGELNVAKTGTGWSITGSLLNAKNPTGGKVEVKADITCG